jgi:hypothetical protein
MKSMNCVSQFVYYSYYFLPVLVWSLWVSNNCSKQTDLIIMDFAKAFDKVPHCRLLYKLKFYGIQKDILNWIKAFLSDRLFVSSCMKSMNCVSQFVYYSYYFLPVLVWSLWVVFHSLFITVITFCLFLYEVYELCFTVCLLQLLR